MGFDRRENGSWRSSDQLMFLDDWTDNGDNVWHRVAGTWVQVLPRAGVGPSAIAPVENLRLDTGYADNPTNNQVYVEWDLPAQVTEPNEVWVRVAALSGDVWGTLPYPSTSWAHLALAKNTGYTLEVKLVLRDGPSVVAESVVRALSFTTDNVGFPPPGDGGPGDGGDGNPPPPPPGGVCTVWTTDVHLERQNANLTWTVVETRTNVGSDWSFTHTYEAGKVYRGCYRSVCDSTPTAWICGEWILVPSDPEDPCADHADGKWDQAPYTDAVFLVPKFCTPNEVRDVISDTLLDHGPLYTGPSAGPCPGTFAIGVGGISNLIWDDVVLGELLGVSDIGPSATLAGWIRLDADMGAGDVEIMVWLGNEVGLGVRGGVFGNVPYAYVYEGGYTGTEVEGTTSFDADEWHHLAVTFDSAANLVTVYLDGADVGSEAWTGVIDLSTDLLRIRGGAGGYVAYLTGWDRALTAAEIPLISSCFGYYDTVVLATDGLIAYWPLNDKDPAAYGDYDGLVQQTSGLVAYWPLDDKDPIVYASYDTSVLATGPTAYWPLNDRDSSTPSSTFYDLQILNDPPTNPQPIRYWVGNDYSWAPVLDDRKVAEHLTLSGSLTFNGSELDLSGGYATSISSSAYALLAGVGTGITVECWVRLDTLPTGSNQRWIVTGGTASTYAWQLSVHGTNGFTFEILTSAGVVVRGSNMGSMPNTGQWYYLAAVVTNPAGTHFTTLYVDDASFGPGSGPGGTINTAAVQLRIGGRPDGAAQAFDGQIKRIAFYTSPVFTSVLGGHQDLGPT